MWLTVRLGGMSVLQLPRALKYMLKNEDGGHGEVSSFAALCTALSATIGTGNIVGVATAYVTGGPGAIFWMWIAALFGLATKYSEGLLAVKYRDTDPILGRTLGGPFYYIERGMGPRWKWMAKLFAVFGVLVGLFGIGTFSQVNSICGSFTTFFQAWIDPQKSWCLTDFVLMISLVLFGFTTILGWDYYSERCLEYLAGKGRLPIWIFRLLYVTAVFIGPYMTVSAVWGIADIVNGLMAVPNMIALIVLSGVVVRETKSYFARLRAGEIAE